MRTLWLVILTIFIGASLVLLLSDEDADERSLPDALSSEMTGDSRVASPSLGADFDDGDDQLTDTVMASIPETPATEATSPRPTNKPSVPEDGGLTIGMDRKISSATVIPGNIKRVGPSELEVDEDFTLEGDGTRENPYRPTWEYLYSAGDTYAPRRGKNELPQRIALLDGAWVNISGYTVFPLVSGKTKEMLIMLNQWDGCCIGVPPTPFDAIEVGLNEAVMRGPKHSISYGTITGRLKVDPYLIEDWLVGLYLLEEGTLQPGI